MLLVPCLHRDNPSPASAFLTCPHSSVIPQYRKLHLLSIGYDSRPRLRPRLTLCRSSLPWKPWIFCLEDSRLYIATHSGILSSIQSTAPFGTASSRMQCSSTNLSVPQLRWRVSAPDIFGAGPLDQRAITHSLNGWLLLSQHPGCLRNPTSFST